MSEHDGEHWWFVARRSILADQIARLGLPPNARLLEAGCGPGGNLAMLSRFGDLDAFEIDEGARKIAMTRWNGEVRPGALPDEVDIAPESFDLIAAFDVIEHISDDHGSVRALADLLKPGGSLIMTVPAYQWLWSRHDERHHHFRRYTRAQVIDLVRQAGLTVRKASHFNTILLPVVIAVRFLKKLAGASESPDDRIPARPVNAALRRVFAAERFWLRRGSFPFGISILCVARKE